MPPSSKRNYETLAEVAATAGCTKSTALRRALVGEYPPATRHGGRWIFQLGTCDRICLMIEAEKRSHWKREHNRQWGTDYVQA